MDQESRLADIRRLEREAAELIAAEQWETAVAVYEDILKIDRDLQFAQEGLGNARSRSALHARLQGLIDEPGCRVSLTAMLTCPEMSAL